MVTPSTDDAIVAGVRSGDEAVFAQLLDDAGGVPAYGNQRSEWDAGCRFDYANPEYR